MTHPRNTLNIVADVGGTNTRVALADGANVIHDTVSRFSNAQFSGLPDVLSRFLYEQGDVDTKGACVAVAGPVQNGQAHLTNLDWSINEISLAQTCKSEFNHIINDLQAQGYALGNLPAGSVKTLHKGKTARSNSPHMMVGIGTGFNIAPVIKTETGRHISASESGHIRLPVVSDEMLSLARYLTKTHGFASVEDVLSGRGVENVYTFLALENGQNKSLTAADIFASHRSGIDPIASATVKTVVQTLGHVVSDLALVQLPFSGIYFVGGVSRALVPHFDEFGFVEAFRDKGRFSNLLETFGLFAVEDDYAALTGCANSLAAQMS